MKQLSALALLISSVAVANQSVTVTGSGNSLSEAKQDALHQASMRQCPTAIVNDREYQNEEMTRYNLTAYNGCIVKNYKVLKEEGNGNFYRVTVNAEIVPSHIPSRIIGKHPEWFYYDLEQHNERLAQVRLKVNHAYELIDEVFYDYPSKAFNIQHGKIGVTYEGVQSYLNVKFKVVWNSNYLRALDETFDIIKDRDSSYLNKSGYTINLGKGHVFEHHLLHERITQHLVGNRPVVRVRIMNNSETREYLNFCRPLLVWTNLFDPYRQDSLDFFPKGYSQDTIKVELPEQVPDDAKIQLDIVSRSFCKEFY